MERGRHGLSTGDPSGVALSRTRRRDGVSLRLGLGLLLLTLVAAACDAQDLLTADVEGSGTVITQTRDVSGFTEVLLASSGDVVVSVTGTDSVIIEAEDNIMQLLTTEVVDGRLELQATDSFQTDIGVRYTITVADLVGIEIAGAGDVAATGVDADSFDVTISGAGSATLEGASHDLTVSISGAGDVDAEDLLARNVSVRIDGAGDAVVHALAQLAVFIDGAGDVEYVGNAALDETINGSGEVRKR